MGQKWLTDAMHIISLLRENFFSGANLLCRVRYPREVAEAIDSDFFLVPK